MEKASDQRTDELKGKNHSSKEDAIGTFHGDHFQPLLLAGTKRPSRPSKCTKIPLRLLTLHGYYGKLIRTLKGKVVISLVRLEAI